MLGSADCPVAQKLNYLQGLHSLLKHGLPDMAGTVAVGGLCSSHGHS